MKCPFCNKDNSEEATKCECGYVFKEYKEKIEDDVVLNSKPVYPDVVDEDIKRVIVKDIQMDIGKGITTGRLS